jgi:hypothetical protein
MIRQCPLSVALLVLPLLAAAAPSARAATPGSVPAATLLVPYFEVDPADPNGQTTLFSVNNAGDQPVVAHAVVWTDWGVPTYSFDLALGPDDVQTLNLRDLFTTGSVPATDGGDIPGCGDPIAAPPLGPTALAALRARHSGAPDPGDGLCYGSDRSEAGTLVGYVTVDVARTCAGESTYFPGEDGYFVHSFGGVPPDPFADTRNVLWGDLFYVAGSDDSAQGTELVQIPYDPEATGGKTFYRLYAPEGQDRRTLLGSRYRGRFLNGGPFDGGTDLLVWLEGDVPSVPVPCGTRTDHINTCQSAGIDLFDEEGDLLTHRVRDITRLAFRLPVGSPELPAPQPFGFFELDHRDMPLCEFITPSTHPVQAWVIPVMKAEGRFSVGLPATRMPTPTQP